MTSQRQNEIALTLLLLCQDPPPTEREARPMEFGAQDKAGALHPGTVEPDGAVRFVLRIVARAGATGGVDFAGPFVHGVPRDRFLYLGYRPVGERVWARRWKVPLATVTLAHVLAAQAGGRDIIGRISASSGSTARLLGIGWDVTGGTAPAADRN
jgi:hypothetical protein